MFNRTRVINTLIDDDYYSTIMNENYNTDPDYGQELLHIILASGFKGYNNFTDAELVRELNIRDIDYLYKELTEV